MVGMSASTLKERLEAVTAMTELFRFERFLYLALSIVSVLVLFAFAFNQWSVSASFSTVVAMCGSSGAIALSLGRILKMWSQALAFLADQSVTSDE